MTDRHQWNRWTRVIIKIGLWTETGKSKKKMHIAQWKKIFVLANLTKKNMHSFNRRFNLQNANKRKADNQYDLDEGTPKQTWVDGVLVAVATTFQPMDRSASLRMDARVYAYKVFLALHLKFYSLEMDAY